MKSIVSYYKNHRLTGRLTALGLALLIMFSCAYQFVSLRQGLVKYRLSNKAEMLLKDTSLLLAGSLQFDTSSQKYYYNRDYQVASEVTGLVAGPKFSASFAGDSTNEVTVTDPVNNITITLLPKYKMDSPVKDDNRLIYPIAGKEIAKVYTMGASGFKEDIVIEKYQDDQMKFDYEIKLPNSTEARMESDGSIGIYGVSATLLGNVSTGTEEDVKLLEQARQNGEKNNLLFTLPAPFVIETKPSANSAKAWFSLKDNLISLYVDGLKDASYPLTIDPSVYVETARKLMRGNNESNIDFDMDNELIQKSQTTGARIDAWDSTTPMTQATWNQGVAAANGYVYRVGGMTSATKPKIESSTTTLNGAGTATFTMNMPATRPAGDLYVAMMCHDGSDGGADTPPAGWVQIADLMGYIAYYKVGTDEGGGNEAATYAWSGYGTEEWAGAIVRISGVDTSDPVSGTAGTYSAASGVPQFPATTPDSDATLVIRGTGFDQDNPSATGWVPTGHTKIASSSSSGGGNNSCGFAAASLDTSPASGVSTGTQTLVNDGSINDDYGSSTIAFNPVAVGAGPQDTVYWAQFNTTTREIESPNPGNGVCSGWCTDSAYNLPQTRTGFSLVAYNGYLYAIGGLNTAGIRQSTVYIAKLGANGEPQLWRPTTGDSYAYWYSDTALSTERSYSAAYAYNNRIYLLGGQTTASTGGVTTAEYANINPNGKLGTWTSAGAVLPDARFGHSVQVYNDVMYLIGGNSSGTLRNTVYYNKIKSDGTLNSWTPTTSFTTARTSMGGVMTALWGGYIYLGGGCTALTSGYCSTVASDIQLASINADGTIAEWNTIIGLANQRIGYNFIAWQNGLYRLGGCTQQNTTSGVCISTIADVDYGVINQDGDASTVRNSSAPGTSPCSGVSPTDCHLPDAGDGAEQGGQMSNMVAINNGYIYVIGGCTAVSEGTNACYSGGAAASGNTMYAALDSTGKMSKPAACTGGTYDTNSLWCIDSTDPINGTSGLATAGITVFNNNIYVAGGTNGSNWQNNVWRASVATDGSLSTTWSTQDFNTDLGLGGTSDDERGYLYVFARANPGSASSNPGNFYMLGGCRGGSGATADGIGCGTYYTDVIKCNIQVSGALASCSTSNQMQIDADNITAGDQGIGLMAGAVYANRLYLVGGACTQPVGALATSPCGSTYSGNRKDTIFARINDDNNIVDEDNGLDTGEWNFVTAQMDPVRRRAVAFGYNGYMYSLAGYTGTELLQDLLFSKINVSTGDMEQWQSSGVVVTPRWDLRAIVSNGYVYAIGGCGAGGAPYDCSSMQPEIQTFQLYNNDSGAPVTYTALSDDTYAQDSTTLLTQTDRIGSSAAVYNGYIYVAGGCTNIGCTTTTSNVQYAPISASDGTIGTWVDASNDLPAVRAWGQLEVAGGYLYYLGGQDDTSTNEQSTVYYVGSFSSGNINAAWSTASGGIGDTNGQVAQARTKFGAAVWNDRIYVVGGLNGSAANTDTVYVTPQLSAGGNIAADSWVSDADTLNVARRGNIVVAYANNLYSFGGNDGTYYLNDSQYTQINSDGTIDAWSYTTSLPTPLSEGEGFAYNGYMYLVGGRSAASTCTPNTIVAPISANTTIASGNNPTGIGEWYETNQRYTGDRYGAAVTYAAGKIIVLGGGCSALVTSSRHSYTSLKSQPQIAKYSLMIDTDTDVFPTKWLMNGLDNFIGARWQLNYRSSTAAANAWGNNTNYGTVTLGTAGDYYPLDGGGTNTNFARYYYLSVNIDSSQTFGYPEDVNRGPTIADLSLFFTSDPSKRMRHGKTFTGGLQQPLDTPF